MSYISPNILVYEGKTSWWAVKWSLRTSCPCFSLLLSSLELSDTKVCELEIRARLETGSCSRCSSAEFLRCSAAGAHPVSGIPELIPQTVRVALSVVSTMTADQPPYTLSPRLWLCVRVPGRMPGATVRHASVPVFSYHACGLGFSHYGIGG